MSTRLFASIFLISALLVGCASETETPPMEEPTQTSLRTPSPEGAMLTIANLTDGDVVTSPFMVEFALEGMDVAPAGVEQEFSGHHHLLINQDELPNLEMPIPADSVHVHFGAGQTSVELELPAGEHTLQLLLGNHLHVPHDPVVASEKITITVQ